MININGDTKQDGIVIIGIIASKIGYIGTSGVINPV